MSDFSLDELKRLGRDAGKEAREGSLNAGIEIVSEDDEGNQLYEFKAKNGEIVSSPLPAEAHTK